MKKLLGIVLLGLMFSNTGLASEKTLFDILEFDKEWDTDGKIIFENKEYIVWTVMDNDSMDKTERKVLTFIYSEGEPKKKIEELSSIYYLSQGTIEYRSILLPEDMDKTNTLTISKNLPKNLFSWQAEIVSFFNKVEKLDYNKSLRRDDNKWVYGISNEHNEWVLYQSDTGKLKSNTGIAKENRENLYKKILKLIEPAADLEKKIKKLEQLYLSKKTGN